MKVVAFAIAVTFLLPIGSAEDRAILATIFLLTRIRALHIRFNQLRQTIEADTFRDILLSLTWIVWSWGNAQVRLGRGPFHVVDSVGVWRGYPLMFEEWISILNPSVRTWRAVHWCGAIADLAILIVASLWIIRRFSESRSVLLGVLLATLTALFVWLNVEPWIDGIPVILRWPDPGWSIYMRGFPWTYEGSSHTGVRGPAIVANVALGVIVWSTLFLISRRMMARAGDQLQ